MKKALIIIIALAMLISQPIKASDDDTFISEVAKESCIKYGEEYDICPELLMAMIEVESSGNPTAENCGCVGLMQISKKWHEDRMDRLGVTDLYDEDSNIHVGADYLAELIDEHGDEMSYILDLYNGNRNAESNLANGKVSKYANKILTRSAQLERLHGK